jgi:energy-coupling factor transport system permease protein
MHPVSLGITLVCAVLYTFFLKGKKAALVSALLTIPMMLLAAVINPIFNHAGVTVLAYFPSGNPLTAESFFYGIAAATMLAAVIFHFACYNEVMTSDKFVYLFGKVIPTLSLVLSMTLKFIPTFTARLKEIVNVQRTLGRDMSSGNILKRMRCAVKILSVLVTWSLESAVETADSMKSRGYGFPGRTSYSIFHFDKRDLKVLLWITALSLTVLWGMYNGILYYSYFPVFETAEFSAPAAAVHTAYLLLCATPVIVELREEYRWKAIK